jgi:hypothetical protein
MRGAKGLGHKIAEASKREPKVAAVEPPKPPEPAKPPEPKITGLTLTANPPNAKLGDTVELVASLQFQGDYKHKDKIPVTLNAPGDRATFAGGLKSITVPTDLNGVASARLTIRRLTKDSAQDAFSALDAEARGESGSVDASPETPTVVAPSDELNSPETAAQIAARGAVKNSANQAFDNLDDEALESEPPAATAHEMDNAKSSLVSASAVYLGGESVPALLLTVNASSRGFESFARIGKASLTSGENQVQPKKDTGICSEPEHAPLQEAVNMYCKGRSRKCIEPPRKIDPPCARWKFNRMRSLACARARDRINVTCYPDRPDDDEDRKKRNKDHRDKADEARKTAERCDFLIQKRCGKKLPADFPFEQNEN